MECDGSARSSGATRIPIQFVANSASSSRNKQLQGHEPRQTRYRQHYLRQQQQQQQQQHQQQRATTSAKDNRASSINGRLSSPPPPRPSLPGRHTVDSVETLFRDWDPGLRSRTDTTPLTVACRSDRDRRSRQRTRPADERPTRGRAELDSGRTASAGGGDSLRRRLVTSSTGGGQSSGDDSGDDDSVISQTRSTSTRSPGQITSPHHTTINCTHSTTTIPAHPPCRQSSYCFSGVCLSIRTKTVFKVLSEVDKTW